MAKKVFILNGHPDDQCLCSALAIEYNKGATEAKHNVRISHLKHLKFDMDFGVAQYKDQKPLEDSLKKFQENLEWCDHFVLVAPMWWGGLPAKLKGLFDRALVPGFAFDPRKVKMGLPEPLLKNKTSHTIVTSDTPKWAMWLFYKNALIVQLKTQIYSFIGIKKNKFTWFAVANTVNESVRQSWIEKIYESGKEAK